MNEIQIIQNFLGLGTSLTALAYAFARKYEKDEYTRTFLFLAFILFVVLFLRSLH